MPKVVPWTDETFGTKQCSVIVPGGTLITDFVLPVREILHFTSKIADGKYKISNLSTFRNEYQALLGAKSFVWSRRNFWHQAVLGTRCGRNRFCQNRKIKQSQNSTIHGNIQLFGFWSGQIAPNLGYDLFTIWGLTQLDHSTTPTSYPTSYPT